MRRNRPPARPASPPLSAPPSAAQRFLPPLIVAVVTFVVFLPALGNEFVAWDDDRNFLDNPHYRGLGVEQLRWMWTTFHIGHYVPLSWMSLGVDYLVWGMRPLGYHLSNLLFHSVNAILLYELARQLYLRAVPAAPHVRVLLAAGAAALLFSAHPLRVESVAWATERRDMLSLAWMLITTLAYLRACAAPRRAGWYAFAVAAFVCALLSKATAVTLPAVLLILNAFPLRRIGGAEGWLTPRAWRVYRELLPFALLAAGAIVLSMIALDPPKQLPIGGKVAVSTYSFAFYLWKTVVPTGLAPLYQMPRTISAVEGRFLLGVLVTIAYVAAVVVLARKRMPVAAALAAFFVLVLPMLGIVQNGPQIAADRYTYHAAPALALLAGSVYFLIAERRVLAVATVTALVVAVLGALTWNQTLVWRNSRTLWERVVAIDPQSAIGRTSLASVLYDEGRVPEAIEHSLRALELDPTDAKAHNAVGMALAREGRFADAVAHYQRAVELSPLDDQPENNWGIALAMQGDAEGAIRHYQRALSLNPDNAGAQVNWGTALVRLNRTDEAIPHFRDALTIRRDYAEAHHNWGVALARASRFAEAAQHFRAALDIDPSHAEARAYLAKALELSK
jgi:protein O-mannosyl-transferase